MLTVPKPVPPVACDRGEYRRVWGRCKGRASEGISFQAKVAGEGVQQVADLLCHATGEAHPADVLSQWEGFGRFCRDELGTEPLTLLAAFGLEQVDPAAEVRASHPDAKADEAAAALWARNWTAVWGRRFAGRG